MEVGSSSPPQVPKSSTSTIFLIVDGCWMLLVKPNRSLFALGHGQSFALLKQMTGSVSISVFQIFLPCESDRHFICVCTEKYCVYNI